MLPIKIGYKTYNLTFVENPMGSSMGLCDKTGGTIQIDKDYAPEEVFNTVVHEILHAIYHVYGLQPSADREERYVNTIANGITEVILRNPKLLKELQKLAKDIR